MYKKIFIALFFICLLIPFVSMAFYKTDLSIEKKYDEAFPSLVEEGEVNTAFFSEVTDYFADHFAFRQEMVTADALVKAKLFRTSNNEKVVVGKEEWLFFQETMDDYTGKNLLDGREIRNCAKVLQLLQEAAEEYGSSFAFTVPPNKNSLYGQYMPGRIKKSEQAGNLEHLQEEMKTLGVHYVDLYEPLHREDTPVYHRLDTHWNNQGAALACGVLLDDLGRKHTDYRSVPFQRKNNFSADLQGMLFPKLDRPDENVMYDREHSYRYVEEVDSTEAINIETECDGKKKTLLMYRDSFGNALIPFLADEYKSAYFTKEVPYDFSLMDIYFPEDVVIELAQRQIPTLLEGVPYVMAPMRSFDNDVEEAENTTATMEIEDQDGCHFICGELDSGLMDEDSDVYICFNGEDSCLMYEAFPVAPDPMDEEASRAYSYGAYIDDGTLKKGRYQIDIITKRGKKYYSTGFLADCEIK